MPFAKIAYLGATPGADANTYLLFSTTRTTTVRAGKFGEDMPPNIFQYANVHKLVIRMKISFLGTINWYGSSNGGTTWRQLGTQAVATPAATDEVVQEFLVEAWPDFKVEWVNGGSAQAIWEIMIAAVEDRAAAV